MPWMNIGRPGYLGKHRDEKVKSWNQKYGPENWRLAWTFGEANLNFLGACRVYEDAYQVFFSKNPDILKTLVTEAAEVYDDEESNVLSGIDYTKQETTRTHVQDIAIRNCLIRLGLWFRGTQLIRIRQEKGTHPLSMTLSPGFVPFHRPDLIIPPSMCPKWAQPNSVEDFYQSNRNFQIQTDPKPQHVCGLSGFGQSVEDTCPACDKNAEERAKKNPS